MQIDSYAFLILTQILCGIYVIVITFSTWPVGLVNPATGVIDIVPRETIEASTAEQVCLFVVCLFVWLFFFFFVFGNFNPSIFVVLNTCYAFF